MGLELDNALTTWPEEHLRVTTGLLLSAAVADCRDVWLLGGENTSS